MKEYSYADNSYSSIWHFKTKCTKDEYEALKKEVKAFCIANKELPVAEQKRLFDEKYGHLAGNAGDEKIFIELRSINRKLTFFAVLVIISLIVAFFSALGSLA